MKGLLPLLMVIALGACTWSKPGKKHPAFSDTLKYTYQNFNKKATAYGGAAKITYPEFKSDSNLNDTLLRKEIILHGMGDYSSEKTLTAFADGVYKRALLKSNARKIISNLDIKSRVIRQDSGLVIIKIDGVYADVSSLKAVATSFINWNPYQHKTIKLNDLFIAGYESELNAIAEKIFRKQENLSDSASLATNYLFKNGRFYLNDNYMISPLGIRFLFNEEEIKPKAAGQTDLFIPYTQIKSLLRPNTVVSQYIK